MGAAGWEVVEVVEVVVWDAPRGVGCVLGVARGVARGVTAVAMAAVMWAARRRKTAVDASDRAAASEAARSPKLRKAHAHHVPRREWRLRTGSGGARGHERSRISSCSRRSSMGGARRTRRRSRAHAVSIKATAE